MLNLLKRVNWLNVFVYGSSVAVSITLISCLFACSATFFAK